MAELLYTEEDDRFIESIIEELDPAKTLHNLRIREVAPASVWETLTENERVFMRVWGKASVITNALGLVRDQYDVMSEIVEAMCDRDEAEMWALRVVVAFEGVPFEVTEEYEAATGDLRGHFIARVLVRTTEAVS